MKTNMTELEKFNLNKTLIDTALEVHIKARDEQVSPDDDLSSSLKSINNVLSHCVIRYSDGCKYTFRFKVYIYSVLINALKEASPPDSIYARYVSEPFHYDSRFQDHFKYTLGMLDSLKMMYSANLYK